MKPIALVVQRCHPDVVGGAESLAWQYAQLLAEKLSVEILTTCAIDAETWEPVLKPGLDDWNGITIRRFLNQTGHTAYWHGLHHKLLREIYKQRSIPDLQTGQRLLQRKFGWSVALQEEWLRHQGPHAPKLYQFIKQNHKDYAAFIFVTYLFPTTYFGVQAAPPEKTILVSALHDEPPAYLPIFQAMAHRARWILFNTHAEADLARQIWGNLPGRVVSMAIGLQEGYDKQSVAKTEKDKKNLVNAKEAADSKPDTASGLLGKNDPARSISKSNPEQMAPPYILYLGRIDAGKGCLQLCEFYKQYVKETGWPGQLCFAGKLQMKLPSSAGIRYLGFLSESEKQMRIEQAFALAMPSPYESLSIVTLEAMFAKIPVLVNAAAPALQEHLQRSGCGFMYSDFTGFRSGLDAIRKGIPDDVLQSGRDYVQENFSRGNVQRKLLDIVQDVARDTGL